MSRSTELRKARSKAGYSQKVVAELLGVSVQTYCKWENEAHIAEKHIPRIDAFITKFGEPTEPKEPTKVEPVKVYYADPRPAPEPEPKPVVYRYEIFCLDGKDRIIAADTVRVAVDCQILQFNREDRRIAVFRMDQIIGYREVARL